MATNLKLASVNTATIDKGVPLPPRRASARKWPLDLLEVGDSFAVPSADIPNVRSAITWEQKKGKKFTLRTLPTETRCWRIA